MGTKNLPGKSAGKAGRSKSGDPFRALFLATEEGVLLVDGGGRIVEANPAMTALIGVLDQDLIGRRLEELIAGKSGQERDREPVITVAGSAFPDTVALRRPDGVVRRVRILRHALTDDRFLLLLRRLPEDGLMENRLRESEHFLRESQRVGRIGSYDLDISSGRWTSTEALDDIFGIPRDFDRTSEHWLTLILPEFQEEMREYFTNTVLRDRHEFDKEYPIRRVSDGAIRWLHGRGSLRCDQQGRLIRMIGTIQDVTDRKTSEIALKEHAEQLRFLSENLADGMVYQINSGVDGKQRVFSYLSPAVERLHELAREDVLKNPALVYEQVVPEHRLRLASAEQEAFDAKKSMEADVQVRLPSGRLCWRRFLSSPRVQSDGAIVWDGIEVDITDRIRSAEEKDALQAQLLHAQKMESVGRLAGGVAHDFNNMLSVILGCCELALRKLEPHHPIRQSIENIQEAARRSADLTGQLLAFARRQTVAPKILDLNTIVPGMLSMVRRLLGETIELQWCPGANLWVIAFDPAQIDQILANLCVNAKDAISGSGRITIATRNFVADAPFCARHSGMTPGEYVLLSVADTGHGMKAEVLAHLFEPFFTTKELSRGTGLGLATVYGIVQQNHGHIYVASEVGKGTTFSLYIPRGRGEAVPEPSKPAGTTPSGRGEQILLVEDDPGILEVGKTMLESLGYRVMTAQTPGEALKMPADKIAAVQLLLTDVVLPEMNGRELVELLRTRFPGLKCLFMSGYTSDVITHHGVLDKGLNFIQKPFTLRMLGTQVRNALDRP